jgi:hypothetical protein
MFRGIVISVHVVVVVGVEVVPVAGTAAAAAVVDIGYLKTRLFRIDLFSF